VNHVFRQPIAPEDQILIVYDVDDICHAQGKRIADDLEFDLADWTSFYIERIPRFSDDLKKRARAALSDEKYFRDIEFYDGVEDILRPEELDPRVEVVFNTKTGTREGADLKLRQLMEKIPGLTSDKITSTIYENTNETRYKDIPKNTFVFVDDSPYNLGMSPAEINVTMIKPWNTSPEGLNLIKGKNVIMFPTLLQINRFIYFRTKVRLMTGI